MATLKEAIDAILRTDAQLTGASNLGTLLGRSATEPYGVHFSAPPESLDIADGSYLTYFLSAQSQRRPRLLFFNITAWGNNYEAILERVYDLLHDASITATDFSVKMIKWDFASPELFDDDKKCYYNQHRFIVKGWKL